MALGLLVAGFLSLAPAAAAAGSATSGAAPPVRVEPESVPVDLFFSGAALHVSGVIPAGRQAAVVCVGHEGRLQLKKKGRVLGLLWMNTSGIVADGVPSLYILCTSAPVAQLAPAAVLGRLGVGWEALEARASLHGPPSAEDGHAVFRDLLRLKRDEGLYSLAEGTALLKPGGPGRLEVSADLFLPAISPPGDYRIRLVSFGDGEGDVVGETDLAIRQRGVAAFTSRMARERGLLFGVVSVVIAIAAGMLTGVAFGRGSKRSH